MDDSIEREVTIEAPVDRVWSLLTEAEHLGTWFGEEGAAIDLRPGGRLTMRFEGGHEGVALIETVEPTSRFAFQWEPGTVATGGDPTEGLSTRVEFTLEPAGDGTRVTVCESGFAALDVEPAKREAAHADNTRGWEIELGHLRDYAARVAA